MIAVAGEALIDLLVRTDGSVAAALGGGPFNAARTVARLGSRCLYLGMLSSDRFGVRLRQALLDDGITIATDRSTAAPTTLAVAELDPSGSATYRIYHEGTSAADLHPDDLRGINFDEVSALHIGSLALVVQPTASTLVDVIGRLPEHLVVMVDLNCRPAAIADVDGYRATMKEVMARADVVKASSEDLEFLAPGVPLDASASAVLEGGPTLVLHSAGADPVRLVLRSGVSVVPVPQVEVVDTVGAGDAFGAAFLAWWIRGRHGRDELSAVETVKKAAAAATTVSAMTCARRGADPPTRADLPDGW
jgi:fructokinase